MADAQIAIIDGDQTQVVLAPGENPAIVTSIPGPQGPAGAGVPTGGAANEVLYKVSSTFGDTAWGPITSAMIGDLQIVNADVSASAAIAGTKISPNFGSQNVTTTGTSTAASFIPTSSTAPTNGLYLSAANSVALSTNGNGRLFIDSSGNVGVGTASPASQVLGTTASRAIAVTGAAGGSVLVLQNDQGTVSTNARIELNGVSSGGNPRQISYIESLQTATSGAGALVFGTHSGAAVLAATERLRITSTGQLSHIGAGSSGSPAVSFSGSAASNSLVVDSNSRVGVGTSSPSRPLHVIGSAVFDDGTTQATIWPNLGSNDAGFGTNTNHPVSIVTNGSRRLNITAAGLVGIGNNAPNRRLEISDSNADNFIRINTSGAFKSGIEFSNSGTAFGQLYFTNVAPYDLSLLQQYTTGSLILGTNNTERARITSSGQLLVGTSTARANFFNSTFSPKIQFEGIGSDNASLAITCNNTSDADSSVIALAKSSTASVGSNGAVVTDEALGSVQFLGNDGTEFVSAARIAAFVDTGTVSGSSMPGRLVFSTTADGAASPTERMRINSVGKILIGQTSTYAACDGWLNVTYTSASTAAPTLGLVNASATAAWVSFSDSATVFGSITRSGSSTVYATSSDYRLKENVAPVTDGITRLQQLKPSRFNFIADPDKTVDGFIAHEVQTIVPEAITGEKDAVDDDGNPVYQGIDQSKLVPLLTAALQEAIAKIESLEARLDAANL